MKYVLLPLFSLIACASTPEKKTPQILTFNSQSKLCDYNLETKKATCEKGVTAEQVMEQMAPELIGLNNAYANLQKKSETLKEKK